MIDFFLVRNNTIVMKPVRRQNDGMKLKDFEFIFTFYSTLEETNPVYFCAENVATHPMANSYILSVKCVSPAFCCLYFVFIYLPVLQFFTHIWIIGRMDEVYSFFIHEWIPGLRKSLLCWSTMCILVSYYRIPFFVLE